MSKPLSEKRVESERKLCMEEVGGSVQPFYSNVLLNLQPFQWIKMAVYAYSLRYQLFQLFTVWPVYPMHPALNRKKNHFITQNVNQNVYQNYVASGKEASIIIY